MPALDIFPDGTCMLTSLCTPNQVRIGGCYLILTLTSNPLTEGVIVLRKDAGILPVDGGEPRKMELMGIYVGVIVLRALLKRGFVYMNQSGLERSTCLIKHNAPFDSTPTCCSKPGSLRGYGTSVCYPNTLVRYPTTRGKVEHPMLPFLRSLRSPSIKTRQFLVTLTR